MTDPADSAPQKMTVDEALRLAIARHRDDDLEVAEKIYRAILDVAPEHAGALHFLGVLRYRAGRREEGEALVRRAIEAAPDDVDAVNNLGNMLKETGRAAEAVACYRKVVAARPAFAAGWHNLGVALRDTGQLEDAVAAFRAALDLDPRLAASYDSLGRGLVAVGRNEEARRIYEQWLTVAPGDPVATHQLAALGAAPVPERAPDAFVRSHFDQFSAFFDQRLASLEYQAPQLVAEALAAHVPEGARLDILDAGCGTGLCGAGLAPLARRLAGVDLSAGMLRKAAERGGYDELVEAELTEFMSARPAAYDAIVSADTLVYFGDLAPVLRAAHTALRAGGTLVFTVEELPPGGDDFSIVPSGRYAHAPRYLEAALSAAGFAGISVRPIVPRLENGEPVHGLLVSAVRARSRSESVPAPRP